jgi:hypothetical protein
MSENVGASTSRNPKGLHGLYRDNFTLPLYWWESYKRQLGRPRRRWVDNIRMNLREIGWDVMDWIDLAQDRGQWMVLVNTVMNLRVPYNAGKFLSSCTIGGFSRRAQLHEVALHEVKIQLHCIRLSSIFRRVKGNCYCFLRGMDQ